MDSGIHSSNNRGQMCRKSLKSALYQKATKQRSCDYSGNQSIFRLQKLSIFLGPNSQMIIIIMTIKLSDPGILNEDTLHRNQNSTEH